MIVLKLGLEIPTFFLVIIKKKSFGNLDGRLRDARVSAALSGV